MPLPDEVIAQIMKPATIPTRERSIEELLLEVQDAAKVVERCGFAFNHLDECLRQNSQDGDVAGERRRRLPIFEWKVSNGKVPMDVAQDLSDLNPTERTYVMVPIATAQGRKLLQAAMDLAEISAELINRLKATIMPPVLSTEPTTEADTGE